MILILWVSILLFYILFGLIYLTFPELTPLGALIFPDTVNDLLLVVSIGGIGVILGYITFSYIALPEIKDFSKPQFINFCALSFISMSFASFFMGVHEYGGYMDFLQSPYIAIFSGSAENTSRDVMISSSGLLAIFAILTSFQKSIRNISFSNRFIICVGFFILLSIFIQGRRENLILLFLCFVSYYIIGRKLNLTLIFKIISLVACILLFAGIGLYIRETASTSGGSVITAIPFAIMYETRFSLATLANEVRMHTVNGLPYGVVMVLLTPILFIIPSFFYSVLGLDKDQIFLNSEPRLYMDKGGQFIFTEAFHSLGYIGVFVHGVILGVLLILFYRTAKRTNMILYHFPLVSLIFVGMRKDLTYGIKYISLLFLLMIAFYLIYSVMPKKVVVAEIKK